MKFPNKNHFFSIFLAMATVLGGCQSATPSKDSDTDKTGASPGFSNSMKDFKDDLTKLLPLVIDSQQFNSPANAQTIQDQVSHLYEVSKQVVHNPQVDHVDPSLKVISNAFSEDLKRAKESLDSGKRDFARYTLMNVTSYCIECHMRTSSAPSFNTPKLEQSLKSMQPMERGEYLLATRQFDRAFSEFQSVIKNSLGSGGNLFELDRAVRYALSISIKFQRDPKKSLEIAELVENSKKSPFYLRQSAQSWDQAIHVWLKEKPFKSEKTEDMLKHSEALVKAGRSYQTGMADRGGDIYFLRALAELHIILTRPLGKDQMGEALYLIGTSYEAVRDLSIWSLHEDYYDTCIRQVPHSKWSEKCYTKMEESVYFGYTGSSGTRLPPEMQAKLDELKKLALPETTEKP